jgi:hypothetical protein
MNAYEKRTPLSILQRNTRPRTDLLYLTWLFLGLPTCLSEEARELFRLALSQAESQAEFSTL